MTDTAIKYPESILAISTEHVRALFLTGFNRCPKGAFEVTPVFQSGLTIRQRQWLDFVDNATRDHQFKPRAPIDALGNCPGLLSKVCTWLKKVAKNFALPYTTKIGDDFYRQLLPYVTIRRGDLVLPYLRGKGVGEKRLAGKASVGWGGHIDAIDVIYKANSVMDGVASVQNNILRELGEELRFFLIGQEDGDIPLTDAGELVFNGYINDTSDDVGRLHLGLSFDFKIKDGYSATSREAELRILPWQSREELYAMPEVVVENWSKLYLAAR